MRFRLLRAGTYRFCSLFQAPSAHSHFVLTTTSTAPIPLPLVFFPSPLFLTQSHSPLHHTIYPNSITNTLYHSHTFNGPHSSENGEVTSNAILNRGKSIDRFSLLFFTLFLHPHTLFRSLLLPFSISFLPLSHSILIFAIAMISQCNPSSAHSIYSMLCVRVHSIQYHSSLLHPNSLPLPTLSLSPWNGCVI